MKELAEKLARILELSDYEARLYCAALNYNMANISQLALTSGIPRTATYRHLSILLSKGLFSTSQIKGRKYYSAVAPTQLRMLLNKRKEELEEVLSELSKNISIPDRKLQVRYFAGFDGIEMAYDILLKSERAKLGKSFENLEGMITFAGTNRITRSIKKRVEQGMAGRMVVAGEHSSYILNEIQRRDTQKLRESIRVSPTTYPLRSSFLVLGGSILILSLKPSPFALLIENNDIATTLDSIHNMVWDRFRT